MASVFQNSKTGWVSYRPDRNSWCYGWPNEDRGSTMSDTPYATEYDAQRGLESVARSLGWTRKRDFAGNSSFKSAPFERI